MTSWYDQIINIGDNGRDYNVNTQAHHWGHKSRWLYTTFLEIQKFNLFVFLKFEALLKKQDLFCKVYHPLKPPYACYTSHHILLFFLTLSRNNARGWKRSVSGSLLRVDQKYDWHLLHVILVVSSVPISSSLGPTAAKAFNLNLRLIPSPLRFCSANTNNQTSLLQIRDQILRLCPSELTNFVVQVPRDLRAGGALHLSRHPQHPPVLSHETRRAAPPQVDDQ